MQQLHKQIELFGYKLILQRRTVGSLLRILKFYENSTNPLKAELIANSYSLENALRNNVNLLPKWKIFTRIAYKRKLRVAYIIDKLDIVELREFVKLINELEGIEEDTEKKKIM